MEETVSPKEYKYTLQANDFVRLFLASDEEFDQLRETLIKDGSIDEHCIRRINYSVFIQDLFFLGEVKFNNSIKEDCRILFCDNLRFHDFHVSNCFFLSPEASNTFNFRNCIIRKVKIANSYLSGIYIEAKSKISLIDILSSCADTFKVVRSKVSVTALNNSQIGFFSISWSVIDRMQVDFAFMESFTLKNDSEIGLLKCNKLVFGRFSINNSKLNSLVAVKVIGSLNIEGVSFVVSSIYKGKLNLVTVAFMAEVNLTFRECIINKLDLSDSGISHKSLLSFNLSKIYTAQLNHFSMLGNLYFRNITRADEIATWNDDCYSNIITPIFPDNSCGDKVGEIRSEILDSIKKMYIDASNNIKRLHPDPVIQIAHSSLGKTEFTDFPFDDYRFEFRSSKISECFVSGGSLPSNNVHIVGAESGSKEEFEQKASFYNQFKKIFEAQGDIYHATQFQAKWAEVQRKLLNLIHKQEFIETPKRVSKIRILFNSTSNDRITLCLNKISNLHGESYLRAFAFIALSALAFYLIHLCAIGRLYWGGEFDPNLLGYYFEYWNPAHKINFIAGDEKISGGAVAFDFVGRVFVSYGIYQFIAAFRKHTKKQ